MEPVNPEFIPESSLDREEMKRMQVEISSGTVFRDCFDFQIEDISDKTVVGVDQAFTGEGKGNMRFSKSVSAAVVMENGETVEETSASAEIDIPYIPGLLAFREGESIVQALKKLETEPDIIFLDGSGRIHFREAGIATHIGVIFDVPAVGIAKNLLCGKPDREWEKLEQGEKIPVRSNGKVETIETGEVIGYVYQSKQYAGKRKVNPLYISPGHRISAEAAVKAVGKFIDGYKLPEPTRLADKRVGELKENF